MAGRERKFKRPPRLEYAGLSTHESTSGRGDGASFVALRGDLAYAKDLIRKVMRDESQPVGLRVRCPLTVAKGMRLDISGRPQVR